MGKVLLYGNGLNFLLIDNFVEDGSRFKKESFNEFDFSNKSLYDFLNTNLGFKMPITFMEFEKEITKKSLEEFFTDSKFVLNFEDKNSIDSFFPMGNKNILKEFEEIKKRRSDNWAIELINFIFLEWIKKCYLLVFEESKIMRTYDLGQQQKLENLIDKIAKQNYKEFFTTNYDYDPFLKPFSRGRTTFIFGSFENIKNFDNKILFDGMIPQFLVKDRMLSNDIDNLRKKFIKQNLNKLDFPSFDESNINIELDIIGWSPIQDKLILEKLSLSRNIKNIRFYLYQFENNKNAYWNQKIIKIFTETFLKNKSIAKIEFIDIEKYS